MSAACYIERSHSGDRITGCVLVTGLDRVRWAAPTASDDALLDDAVETSINLGRWIASKLSDSGVLDALVLDTEGSYCSWTRAPSADRPVVEAVVKGIGADAHAGTASATYTLGPDHEIPGGAELETLEAWSSEADSAAPERLAVLSVTDAAVRVLMDELDRQGVEVRSVRSIWHAMAAGWDVGKAASLEDDDDRFVGESDAPAACFLIEPRGKLLWAWSRGGRLLASGAIRLSCEPAKHDTPTHEHGLAKREDAPQAGSEAPVFRAGDVSRLAAEWMGWASQLGVTPTRIVGIAPALNTGSGGLSASQVAQSLTRSWPSAPLDLAVEQDPVAATLEQALRKNSKADAGDGAQSLTTLSARPGKLHRNMYVWSSAALLAGAAAFGVWGWRVSGSAESARAAAAGIRAQWVMEAETIGPEVTFPPGYEIQNLTAVRDRESGPSVDTLGAIDTVRPVLIELESLTYVIGNPEVEVVEINLNPLRPRLVVRVADIGTYELLRNALSSVGDSEVAWTGTSSPGADDTITATFTGSWIDSAEGSGS